MARYEADDDDPDNPFDRNGLLKDGRVARTPLMMRDSDSLSPVQRAIMDAKAARRGFDDSQCHYQPGPVRGVDRSAAAKAYQDAVAAGEQAWRGDADKVGSSCTDDEGAPGTLQRIDGRLVCVPDDDDDATDAAVTNPRRKAAPVPRRAVTSDEARSIKKRAYDAMVAESLVAWKNPL